MPITTMWLMPEKIIYLRSTGRATIEDMQQIFDDVANFLGSTDDPFVHLIIDGSSAQMPKISVSEIRDLFSELPNSGEVVWTVVVNPSPFLRFMGTLAMQFAKMRNRQVSTIDEALQFLSENDETLPSFDELKQMFNTLKITE